MKLAVDRIYHMNAIKGLKLLEDESVDLIVTDPPYNIASPNKITIRKGKIVSTMAAWGQWDHYHPFDYDVLIQQVISQCWRVLKPGGALYMFTAREENGYFIRLARQRGFVYRNQVAMIKKNPLPSLHKGNWRSGFELCMYLVKGSGKPKTFNFLSQAQCVNAIACGNHDLSTEHPTEKPLSFIQRLVEVSSNPGDLVLDPFMGSGTTAVAARQLGRRYLGFDTDAGYVRMARQRLKGGPASDAPHQRPG